MTTSTDALRLAGLYRLLAWSSPAFPTGGFSYSHGLEAAVESGALHDRDTLQEWVVAIVLRGSGRVDADILRDAYRAAHQGDSAALTAVNRRGLAYRATLELALESGQQGEAFLNAWQSAWASPQPAATDVAATLSRNAGEGKHHGAFKRLSGIAGEGASGRSPEAGEGVCHAVAFGAAAVTAGIAVEDALLAYLQAFASNLVSAGMRLGIVGQTDGQRILAALETEIAAAVTEAMTRSPDEFGSATFAADLTSMAHETQYTRLFRS
jgi:urease accessory protein